MQAMDNIETALLIRNKNVVDMYTERATPQEKLVLKQTENEAQLTKEWVLQINQQNGLISKTLAR
jgi:hypothetical protein